MIIGDVNGKFYLPVIYNGSCGEGEDLDSDDSERDDVKCKRSGVEKALEELRWRFSIVDDDSLRPPLIREDLLVGLLPAAVTPLT